MLSWQRNLDLAIRNCNCYWLHGINLMRMNPPFQIKKNGLILIESSANSQTARMRKILLVLSFIFSTALTIAQQLPPAYTKAKSDLEAKEFILAKEGFSSFLNEAYYGVLSYYAAFHSAEAALQLTQVPQAIELLASLKGKD